MQESFPLGLGEIDVYGVLECFKMYFQRFQKAQFANILPKI